MKRPTLEGYTLELEPQKSVFRQIVVSKTLFDQFEAAADEMAIDTDELVELLMGQFLLTEVWQSDKSNRHRLC